MSSYYRYFVIAILCCGFLEITMSQCDAQITDNSTQEHPCGTDDRFLTRFVPQGWKGADFKKACIKHDDCYEIYGVKRASCDESFRKDLLKSCEHSRRPQQCQRVSRVMYWVVDKIGQESFDKGQRFARKRLAFAKPSTF